MERSIALKLAGRLSVIVAIGPSIASSAGSDGGTPALSSVVAIGEASLFCGSHRI
jgi:hypothetical protein